MATSPTTPIQVLKLAGNYLIVPQGGSGLVTVYGNTTLGGSSLNSINPIARFINNLVPRTDKTYNIGIPGNAWNYTYLAQFTQVGDGPEYKNTVTNTENVGNYYPPYPDSPMGRPYNPDDTYGGTDGEMHRRAGAVYVAGGVGIEKDLNVGGWIYGRVEIANTSLSLLTTSTNIDYEFNPVFVAGPGERFVEIDTTGIGNGWTYNPAQGRITTDRIKVGEGDDATGENTGVLVVKGGASISKKLYVKDTAKARQVLPLADNSGAVGTSSTQWAEAYIHNLYTRIIASTTGTVEIRPQSALTDVYGDIRVRGQNPIGTAPVITNVLYVTVDGDDTNDGRAQDPSRACRTIGGAIKSPYFQPGTQINVSAGRYLEDNPLELKPYTSIKGSDIRTTFIEPINKTQDLFHLQSGCYLNYMTFLNGRSGLLEGEYATGYNRGAYATAFPPQTGDNRIDLFHSPYIQNCTNQSGPWLKDGTMFVPNQTVQIPSSVGTGTWEANTTSIVVAVSNGGVKIGDYINAGQQNPGFFNARTLLLANKPFLQSQVVAFIESTFNSNAFSYVRGDCERDTALIVHAIAMDLLYDSNSDSTFAGLQYWSQSTRTGIITSELTTTTNAINQLKNLTHSYVSGGNQSTIDSLFDKIVDILNNGVVGVTDDVVYGGLPSTNPTTLSDYTALQTNRAIMQQGVIDWIEANKTAGFVYSTSTCYRDVGYIIDSVSFDFLHGGNVQSIKSGVYYWGYDNTSVLPTANTPAGTNELPATVAAYSFIKSIATRIVTGQKILSPYQTVITQTTSSLYATSYEADVVKNKIDIITNIIRNGPDVAEAKVPIALVENTSTGVLNAYNLLIDNISFIVAEVTAFIDATMNNFEYNRQKSYRDTGILIENMAYDMTFGGNEKSVESGKAYWNGPVSVIANSITQCISGIDYLNQLAQLVVINSTCPILTTPTGIPSSTQVINTVLTGGAIAISSIKTLLNITTNIMANGPDVAPAKYNSPGPDAAYVSAEILLQANRTFIQENVLNYINYNLCVPPKSLPYNQIKCKRDAGVILDSIASDLLFPTDWHSQSTFAGLQYYAQTGFVGAIKDELYPTIGAIKYLRDLSIKVVKNITSSTDKLVGVNRYTDATQTTASNYATSVEVDFIRSEFTNILTILDGKTTGWTDLIIPNGGIASAFPSVKSTVDLLTANTTYIANEVVAYVNANNPGFVYDQTKCARDVGYILTSIIFDLTYGGNRQSIQAGLSYYVSRTNQSVIPNETAASKAAFTFLGNLASTIAQGNSYTALQSKVKQVTNLPAGRAEDGTALQTSIGIINGILDDPTSVGPLKPITLTKSAVTATQYSYNILKANRAFIVAETIEYLDQTYNPNSFKYDQELCYRDTGLIIDAVSQDILLGGNQKSIEAGVSYWNQGFNYVSNQISTTTLAINYARDLALKVVANTTVTSVTGTVATQVINPFFQYGGDYMPQQSIRRNFDIVTNIITNGKEAAPPIYAGGGLSILTGLNGSDVKIAPRVTTVDLVSGDRYKIGLDTATVGFGLNSTLYFGDVYIYPQQDAQVEAKSLAYTGDASSWNRRKVDPVGSMGGSLVDGGVISDRSPIQSFVYDAFTQLNQGGIGVKVTNNGYAQLVSVFTIFCSVGVICDNGGIASITNSNCNFGDISLIAKGYGPRSFSGTVYNPKFRSYPFSPDGILNGKPLPYLDQFYPEGYWPNNGGRMEVFLPDAANRPHIGLVMEVVAPDGHINEQGLPGFLNAQPSTALLSKGSIALTGISTTDVYIGNTLYIRDQFGSEFDQFAYLHDADGNPVDNTGQILNYQDPVMWPNPNYGVYYASSGTIVADVNYNKIILNQALTNGGGDANNANYFTLYFCGNSYYTVQTSTIANNPYVVYTNILEANSNPNYQGPTISQVAAHVSALTRLKEITSKIVANQSIVKTSGNTVNPSPDPLVTGGADAIPFIELHFDYLINIVGAATLNDAQAIVPSSAIVTSGTVPQGAGGAVTLIKNNIDFMKAEIVAYVEYYYSTEFNSSKVLINGQLTDAQKVKCARDVGLILQQLIYDLQTGGNYNMVYSGLSYWSREGTYHIVELGEAVTNNALFPDGTIVNFYQRSYISASGYLFEYVGAGTNYGALPQRGVADPVQSKETVQLNSGKVFFTSTDQNGDFRIGQGLVISQATGVLSGRTFVQSLYANMTPFILAIE